MKAKRQTSRKHFLCGCLTTLAVMGLIGSAAATVGSRTVTVDYNDIKVTLDGVPVDLVDANGNAVEPFAIEGTTYLPIRAVATALGLEVAWDAGTQTAVLTTAAAPTSQTGTVIMDEGGIKITFLGFEALESPLKGYHINLRIENTTDTNYTVQVRNLSVNGIMADSVFSCDVAAGKVANDAIWVINTEESGIDLPITEAEFTFHVFETEDLMTGFDSEVITVN